MSVTRPDIEQSISIESENQQPKLPKSGTETKVPVNPAPSEATAAEAPPRYDVPAPQIVCLIHDNIETWDDPEDIRQDVCISPASEPLIEFNGKHYCLFHLPNPDKDAAKFKKLFEIKHNDMKNRIEDAKTLSEAELIKTKPDLKYDFRYIRFPGEITLDCKFAAPVYLRSTEFYGDANFNWAIFTDTVDFSSAIFLKKAAFERTTFESEAYFYSTQFKDSVSFMGAFIEQPEKVKFYNVEKLFPSSFVDTDISKVTFISIIWGNCDGSGKSVRTEIAKVKVFTADKPHPLLSKTCRQLSAIYDAEKLFRDSSNFNGMNMECQRREANLTRFAPFNLHWWYWFSSFYGESWKRAILILLALLALFAGYYYFAFFNMCVKDTDYKTGCVVRTMYLDEAIHQSMMTAALQNVEYRKTLTTQQDIMILLEKIAAPLQAALLALAIRRKFMR